MLGYFFIKQRFINFFKNNFYFDYGIKFISKKIIYDIKNNQVVIQLPDSFKGKKKVKIIISEIENTKKQKVELMKKAFKDAAGNRYPRMSNFSFDYGNAHWTVLDADTYVDWTDIELKNWVIKDLADSKNAAWHFVFVFSPMDMCNGRFIP